MEKNSLNHILFSEMLALLVDENLLIGFSWIDSFFLPTTFNNLI